MYTILTHTRELSNEYLQGVVRIWGLYTILTKGDKFVEKCKTKEKGVGLLAVLSCEKVNTCGK